MITITCPTKAPKWIQTMIQSLNSNFASIGGGGYDGNPATIVQDATHRFATDTEKATWNGKQDALGYTPSNVGHTHAESDIPTLATTLSNKSSVGHGHNQSDITDLVTDLAAKAGTDQFTSVAAGLVPASGGGTTNFLRADGTFAAPSGGGGVSLPVIMSVSSLRI